MRFSSRAIVPASVLCILAGFAIAGMSQATLGETNPLPGNSLSKDLTEGSVEPLGEHSITGTCQNATGAPMSGVTIELIATSGTPPGLGDGSKVNGSGPAEGTAKGKKWKFNPPIASSGALSLDLTTTPPASQPSASTFKIYITPSNEPKAGVEADYLGLFVFTPQRGLQATDLESHGNRAKSLLISNSDPNSSPQRVTRISGTYSFPAGELNEITSVDFLESFGGRSVSGATITISSATQFTVDGISIPTGTTRALVVHTLLRSVGTATLSLRATYQQ